MSGRRRVKGPLAACIVSEGRVRPVRIEHAAIAWRRPEAEQIAYPSRGDAAEGVLMTRWLVTGATGLLGANAMVSFASSSDAVGIARRVPISPVAGEFLALDIADHRERRDAISRTAPSAVLHAAAISTIEGCEADPVAARELNVTASVDLARQAAIQGIPFVFVSTDAVFDGEQGEYSEEDATSPASEYGRLKAEAEQRVLDVYPEAIVARVNFYGWSPTGTRSLAEFFWHRLSRGERTPGFVDVRVSTTYVGDLVAGIEGLVDVGASGIVHVASSRSITKFAFGQALAEEFGFDPALVVESSARDVLSLPRGADLSLRTDLLESLIGRALPDQRQGLHTLRAAQEGGIQDRLSTLRAPEAPASPSK